MRNGRRIGVIVLSAFIVFVLFCPGLQGAIAATTDEKPVNKAQAPGETEDKNQDEIFKIKIEGMARALGMPDMQVRIARLLFEVKNDTRSPESFYFELKRLGANMFDVIAVRSRLVNMPDQSFARQVMGDTYPENGTLVEQRILTWRKQQTLEAINEVLQKFAGRVPADGVSLMVSHVGKWANQDSRSLTFTGDIDFSFVSNDVALVEEMKAAYATIIQRRTQLDPKSLDSVCTAHSKASLDVYIGKHGMAFAEEQMKVNFIVDPNTGTTSPAGHSEVLNRLTTERELADAQGKEVPKPAQNTEPGLSMEMVRHFQHDIVAPGIYDMANAVIKAGKYLDRSYKSLEKAGGKPANTELASFAKQITELANAKPQTPEIREKMIRLISEQLGGPPKTVWDAGKQKLVLALNAGQIADFHREATAAMWETVKQGQQKRVTELEDKLREVEKREKSGDTPDEEAAKLRQEMVELVDMVEAEIKAFHGERIPTEVHTYNAKTRAMLDRLIKRFGLKTLSLEELKDKKFVEELLRAEAQGHSKARREMLMSYIMDRSVHAAELAVKGTEKVNKILDYVDDTLLGHLRGDSDWDAFEAEIKAIHEVANDPQKKSGVTGRIETLKSKVVLGIKAANMYINEKIQATAAGRQGVRLMMVYGLVDEMRSYRDAFYDQGWEGVGTELFRRRIPFISAAENAYMGNTWRAGWDVVTTLIPPLGLPEAALGITKSIFDTGYEYYWSSELNWFVDSLYESATWKLTDVTEYQNAKAGTWRLVSAQYQGSIINVDKFTELKRQQIKTMKEELKKGRKERLLYGDYYEGLTDVIEINRILKNNITNSDPALVMIKDMMSDPAVGKKLIEHYGDLYNTQWEQAKFNFILGMITRLEERKTADMVLGMGMLPEMFGELRDIAKDLGIESQVMTGLDAEVGTNNLKKLVNLLWDAKRTLWDQPLTESETNRAAQIVRLNLDSYRFVLSARSQIENMFGKGLPLDRNDLRILTEKQFLTGRHQEDEKAAKEWLQDIVAIRNLVDAELVRIKGEKIKNARLDNDFDGETLDKVLTHDAMKKAWNNVFRDSRNESMRQASITWGRFHHDERLRLINAFREHYSLGADKGKSELEQQGKDQAEKEKTEKEKAEKERVEKERSEKERREREQQAKVEQERLTQERLERERRLREPQKLKEPPACTYEYSAWGECSRATKAQTRSVISTKPEGCVEKGKPSLGQECTPPPTAEELRKRLLDCICYESVGQCSSPVREEGGKFHPEPVPCNPLTPPLHCTAGAPCLGCGVRGFMKTSGEVVENCFKKHNVIYDKNASKELDEINRKHMKPLKVSFSPDTKLIKAQYGDIVKLTANAEGGIPGYTYSWSGNGESKDNTFTFINTRQPGSYSVSVMVNDSDGNSAAASTTIAVEAISIRVENTSPSTDTIPVGTKAQFRATVMSGDRPASGDFNYLWQPHPEIEFTPFEKSATTTATFRNPGRYGIFVQAFKKVGVVDSTVGESNQVSITVVNPKWKLEFTPQNPLIGQEVKAKILPDITPEPDMKEMNFRWQLPSNAKQRTTSQDDREITFLLTDTNPANISCLASTKYDNQNLGGAGKTIRAQSYQVTIGEPRYLESPPQIWQCDTQFGQAQKCGMVTVKPNQFAVFRDVFLRATVTPSPESPRYRWTIDPSGSCGFPGAGSEIKLNCSNTGTYTAKVEVTNAEGAKLGEASQSVTISISQESLDNSGKAREAYEKLQTAKELVAQGKLDEAISLAGEAAKLDPKNMEASTLLNKWRTEKQTIQSQLNNKAQGLINEAWSLEKNKRYEEALKKYKEAHALIPNAEVQKRIVNLESQEKQANRLLNEGFSLEKQGSINEALKRYREAQGIYPDDDVARKIAELEQKDRQAAQRLQEGYQAEKGGRLAEAAAKYRQAYQIVPNQQIANRIAELEKAIDEQNKKRHWATQLRNQGAAFQQRGMYREALEKYRESLAYWPDPGLADHIAKVEAEMKRQGAQVKTQPPLPEGTKPPTSTERPGGEQQVFNNNNISGVNNNPSTATTFRTDRPWLVTYVMTYHWNGGRGQTPGAISLRHQDGTSYGPWQTRGRPNQGSQTNLCWECWPSVVIKPGVYTVIDSHPASWAWNAQSGGGIAEIKGVPQSSSQFPDLTPPQFDGGSYVEVQGSSGLNLSKEATLMTFVRFGKLPSDAGRTMAIMAKAGAHQDLDLQVETNNKVHFYVAGGGIRVVSKTTINPNTWYHIAAVYRGGESIELYLNGKLDAAEKIPGTFRQENGSNVWIGANSVWGGRFLIGGMKDVSVWSRAISAGEINKFMAAAPSGSEPGLEIFCPLSGSLSDKGPKKHSCRFVTSKK